MSKQFIIGTPEGIDELLSGYDPLGLSNLSIEELRGSVTGYVPDDGFAMMSDDGKLEPTDSKEVYFFFPKEDGSIDIGLRNHHSLYVPLSLDKYGFSTEREVGITPQKLDLNLSEEAQAAYCELLDSTNAGLSTLLERVGYIINHSMEYDFEKVIRDRRTYIEEDCLEPEELELEIQGYEAQLRSKGYSSHGGEVMKGICGDAGKLIRQLLFSLGINEDFGIVHVTSNNGFRHDTTLIFDKLTGEWAVINSKSPTKPYNLVPKEKLYELGTPYIL